MAIILENGTSTTHNGSLGNDIFSGGIGFDRYSGGFGSDSFTMVVDKNLDTIAGGEGVDRLSYVNADRAVTVSLSDTGAGSVTSEYLLFQFRDPNGVWHQASETVQVATLSGIEDVGGTRFNDTISGNLSANAIAGGDGKDILDGKGGNDVLVGGFGADSLTGGEGFDTFSFSSVADSRFVGAPEYTDLDTITDFKYGQDKIDLSQIDADTTVAGNQAFEFAVGGFTGEAGELRTHWGGTGRIIWGDTDGDAVADFTLMVKGLTLEDMHQAPTSADFIL